MSTTSKAASSTVAALGKLIAGIQEHQPTGVFLVDGKSVTAAEAVTTLQGIINAYNALGSAHAALKEAVVKADGQSTSNRAFVRDLKLNLQMLYAASASTLGDFGLAPRKVPVLTPAEKLASAAKAKATRKARHTMGSKQKAAITGTSTPAVTTPEAPATSSGSTSSGTSTGH